MAYKSYLAGSPVTFYSPNEYYINAFDTFVENSFYNTSDVFTIKEETYFASGSYQSVDVRLVTAVDNLTGIKLGDDFKKLLFKPDHDQVKLGEKFWFDGNYWLTVSTTSIKTLVTDCMVRRCNNVLKWSDSSGNVFTEHCIIDYNIATPDNKNRTDPIVSDGTIKVIAQLNDKTKTISENQRFLFGRTGAWNCYRLYGGGILNFLNNNTETNTSAQLVEFAMGKNFVNDEEDDVVNGFADFYKYLSGSAVISGIQILPISGSIVEGETQTFTCYLYSGGAQQSGSFAFTIDVSSIVPIANYTLTTLGNNSFSVENIEKYLTASLPVKCVAGSGSRIAYISLRGAW